MATDQFDTLEGSGARALARGVLKRTPEALEPPTQIASDDDYAAVPFGKKFIDPEGNTRTKLWEVSDDATYENVPEGAQYRDPEGQVRTKPAYQDIDFTAHTLYDMAVTDAERRNALERSYPGKVKQLPSGEFYVDDDGVRRKPRSFVDPRAGFLTAGAKVAAGAAPMLGAIAGEIGGGLAGSAVPGAGTMLGAIGGAGVGGAGGQAFNDMVLQLAGVYDRTAGEEVKELALSAGFSAGGTALGRGAAGVIRGAGGIPEFAKGATGGRIAANILGAEPEAVETALGIAERGERGSTNPIARMLGMKSTDTPVGVSTWAKEAPHLANMAEVFDPAFRTQRVLNEAASQNYEQAGKDILSGLGVNRAKSLGRPTEAVPTQQTGEAVMRRAREESAKADADLKTAMEAERARVQAGAVPITEQRQALQQAAENSRRAAQNLIDSGYQGIARAADDAARISGAGHNGGDLWAMVGAQLQAVRRGIQERASVMYRQADELAGHHLPNTEGLPELADQFANQLPEEFQRNQPSLVRQLREMAGERDENGQVVREPTRPTFGQLHNLRSQMRQSADFYRLNSDIKNGTYKFFARRVDEALRDTESVPELAPAVEQLNRADQFYRENMPIFEAQQIKAITRGLEAGEPADPKNLFDAVVREGHTDLTNRIREMVGPNLWAGVQAADLQQMLQASRGLLPNTIDGRAFVRQVLDRHRSGLLEAVHERDVTGQLLRQAQAIEMLDGRLPLTVQPGDTMADVIGRARMAAQAAQEAAKRDPLAMLNREMKQVDRDYRQKMAEQQKARKADPLGFLYDPTTGASEAVNHILGSEDLILATAARFGEKSPEFEMLRQIYAQRVLEGTVQPSKRLAKISPEVQQLMFPGSTLEQMQLVAKEMDFLFSGKTGSDPGAGLSMSATAKVEHPWASILGRGGAVSQFLTAPTKVIPLADYGGRYILTHYYAMWQKLSSSPSFLRWVQKGLNGDRQAREIVRAQIQRAVQKGGAIGAGVGEAAYQSGEATPEVLPDERSSLQGLPQYAQDQSTMSDAGPQQWDEAEQAQQAREAAAGRTRQAVKPVEGRQEGELTESLFDLIPGRAVLRSVLEGDYQKAGLEAGLTAATAGMPLAGKAASMGVRAAMEAAPGATKTVLAAGTALTGLLTGSEAGNLPLSPEQRQQIKMQQMLLKQKQDAANADAELRKKEADQKAERDAEAARQQAKTQVDLQKELARIEAEKERAKLEVEEKRRHEEEEAAQRALDAAKAEAKRMAERPFREKYPQAALGLTMGGMAVAASLPFLSNRLKAKALNKYISEWRTLDKKAAEALEKGTAEEKRVAVQRLSDAANKWTETEARLKAPTPWSTKLAVGMAGAEGAALPAEIDYALQPPGSEAHKQAEDFFTNPMEMARVIATYLGGTMAGMTASKFPFRYAEPPTGSGGLIKAYEQQMTEAKKAASAEKRAKTRAAKAAEKKETGEPAERPKRPVGRSAGQILRELGVDK